LAACAICLLIGAPFHYHALGLWWFDRNRAFLTETLGAAGISEHELAATKRNLLWGNAEYSVDTQLSPEDIVQRLGQPTGSLTASAVADGRADYPVAGYASPGRPISHLAIYYIWGEAIVYFFFDREDRLEGVFAGPA